MSHVYLSTYCLHGLHDDCKRSCKTCKSKCICTQDGCQCPKLAAGIETGMPDVLDKDPDEIDMERLAPEVSMMLRNLTKPRANLGSSGPPGRAD